MRKDFDEIFGGVGVVQAPGTSGLHFVDLVFYSPGGATSPGEPVVVSCLKQLRTV